MISFLMLEVIVFDEQPHITSYAKHQTRDFTLIIKLMLGQNTKKVTKVEEKDKKTLHKQ